MRVTHRRELVGSVAHGSVERSELVAERRSCQAGEPPRLLAAFTDVVHGGLDIGRAGEHRVQLFDRVVETLDRNATNLPPHSARRIEHISHQSPVNPAHGARSNVST